MKIFFSLFKPVLLLSLLGINSFAQEPSITELNIKVENEYAGRIFEDPENPGSPYYRGINITKADGTNLPQRTKPLGFNKIPGNFGVVKHSTQIKIQIVGLKYNHIPSPRERCLIALIDSQGEIITNSFATESGGLGSLTQVEGSLNNDGIAINQSYQLYECHYVGFLGRDFLNQGDVRARFEFVHI